MVAEGVRPLELRIRWTRTGSLGVRGCSPEQRPTGIGRGSGIAFEGVGCRTARRTVSCGPIRAAVCKRDCYLAAQYRRLVKRRGDKKAIVAVAHSILVIAYHVLRDGQSYRELGGDYFDRLSVGRLTRYHTKRLAALGYAVTLRKSAA